MLFESLFDYSLQVDRLPRRYHSLLPLFQQLLTNFEKKVGDLCDFEMKYFSNSVLIGEKAFILVGSVFPSATNHCESVLMMVADNGCV